VRRVQRGSPKVLAHIGTLDSCWNPYKNILSGSLANQNPIFMTYIKAWQWRYIYRNVDVCNITAKMVRKLKLWKKNYWPCDEISNHARNIIYFEDIQHVFINSITIK
jgi:hypothetical protein